MASTGTLKKINGEHRDDPPATHLPHEPELLSGLPDKFDAEEDMSRRPNTPDAEVLKTMLNIVNSNDRIIVVLERLEKNLQPPVATVSAGSSPQSLGSRTGIISIIVTVLLAFIANLGLGLYNWGIQRAQLDQTIRNQEKTDHKLDTLKDLYLLDIGKRSQAERDKMSMTEKSKIDDLLKEDSK